MSRVYCMAFIESEIQPKMIERQRKALEAALSTNPETEKKLRKLIREVLIEARKNMVGDASDAMKSDPRETARAIRTSVYKAILGGNVNIFNSRKAHGQNSYIPPRNPSHRGGNRRSRSQRTNAIMSYAPLDRGFILRWINDGMTKTNPRVISFTKNSKRKVDKWNKHPNTGNRGSITARHFFGPSAQRWVQQAADNLNRLIYAEVKKLMDETN